MSAKGFPNLHPVADDYVGGEDGSITLDPSNAFVSSPAVQEITDRALAYLAAGYAVHFSGPPGTGKTTLAFHVAAQLGRPAILLHGDHEFGSSDLIGRESGYSKSRVVDNYISSVSSSRKRGARSGSITASRPLAGSGIRSFTTSSIAASRKPTIRF